MKQINLIVLILACCLMAGCFISDNLMKEFLTINASLEKSNKAMIVNNQLALHSLENAADKQAFFRADTLHQLNLDAYNYVDSIKKIMMHYDPKGDNINLPHELLVNTFKGIILQQKLSNVYNYAHTILPDSAKIPLPDTSGFHLKSTAIDTAWTRKNFKSSPTASATAGLSSYQRDCLELEYLALVLLKRSPKKAK